MNATKLEAQNALQSLAQFMCRSQSAAVRELFDCEEKQFFFDKIVELHGLVSAMPVTYDQDGMGDAAIVTLHYFRGNADWYIMEKDCDPDGEGQIQAFGYVDLFGDVDNAELGYISLPEVLAHGAELDFHFTPRTIGELKKQRNKRAVSVG